jgi:hypothetical protein
VRCERAEALELPIMDGLLTSPSIVHHGSLLTRRLTFHTSGTQRRSGITSSCTDGQACARRKLGLARAKPSTKVRVLVELRAKSTCRPAAASPREEEAQARDKRRGRTLLQETDFKLSRTDRSLSAAKKASEFAIKCL